MVGGGHLLPRLLWDVGAERSAIYLISVIFRKMNLAASVQIAPCVPSFRGDLPVGPCVNLGVPKSRHPNGVKGSRISLGTTSV